MVGDIILGSALRSTLLSNIQTQRALDNTTLRLATGLEVNSALDDPQNFFASQSLSNRARDIERLLDGIGQSLQTIREANTGISALSQLTEQAQAVAQEALELNRNAPTEARALGNTDLTTVTDLTQLNGVADGDQLFISTRSDSQTGLSVLPINEQSITINTGDNIDQIIAEINALPAFNIRAGIDPNGRLEIRTLSGELLNLRFDSALGTTAGDLNLANALGFGDVAFAQSAGFFGAQPEVQFSVIAEREIESFQLLSGGQTAQRSDQIGQLSLTGPGGILLFFGLDAVQDTLSIGVDHGGQQTIILDGNETIQGLLDRINNSSLGSSIEADFDDDEGRIIIRAIDDEVESIQTGLTSNGIALAFFGFNAASPIAFNGTDADSIQLGIAAGPSATQIALLERDFNNIRDQIDNIVEDARYRGVNLLGGDDLITDFNEDRDNQLITEGVDFTSLGLGLERADFDTLDNALDGVNQARDALKEIRNFGQSIANNLSIIETREAFSRTTINTLESGSDDLTVADQNEEGANLLATQTRQAIGVNVLSFVSQQQSAILLLF